VGRACRGGGGGHGPARVGNVKNARGAGAGTRYALFWRHDRGGLNGGPQAAAGALPGPAWAQARNLTEPPRRQTRGTTPARGRAWLTCTRAPRSNFAKLDDALQRDEFW